MANILIVGMRVYAVFKSSKNYRNDLILNNFMKLLTNRKTGKTSMRVISFIHSALFLLCGFLFIDTKRLFYLLPVQIAHN
jgi:hypothetical protein